MTATSIQYALYVAGSLCFLAGSVVGWVNYLTK
jgi:hypothetical protein